MKIERLFIIIFGGAAILLLAGAAFWGYTQNQFLKNSHRATGFVTRLERRESSKDGRTTYLYFPEIQFKPDQGKPITFMSHSGSYPAAHHQGEAVEVVYDPLQPDRAEINTFGSLWFGPLICLVFAAAFGGVAGGFAFFAVHGARKVAWLKQYGQRIRADIIEVGLNNSITVNGRHPYRVSAQWQNPGSGKIHVFNSQNIWFNPQPYLPGKTVEVLIDAEKPGRYWVDLSFLPEAAE